MVRITFTLILALCALAAIAGQTTQVSDLQPQDAATAILNAFGHYDIVGMTAAHNNEKQDQFVLALVRTPGLASRVNDIVVECGNSRYQALIDRYIAGGDVPLEDVRRAWRESSVLMCALSGFNEQLLPVIRAINAGLPVARRLRVLLGEPAVDWIAANPSSARSVAANRNPFLTSILTTEVLAKGRKALVLVGTGHLFHDDGHGTAVSAYEKTYPRRTYVITTHDGFAAFIDLERGHQLEARMKAWPIPSIVALKDSWLADLDLPYFLWPFTKRIAGMSITDLVDAYLYLGPGGSLTYEETPASVLNDAAYLAELSRRFGPNDVDSLRRRNLNRSLHSAADIAEAHRFAAGAECVGAYAGTEGGPLEIEIDFRKGVLSARGLGSKDWTELASVGALTYTMTTSAGAAKLEFQQSNSVVNRLSIQLKNSDPPRMLVRSF